LHLQLVDRVIIQVPASTSNIGSGFDTLGLAVNLYTRVGLEATNEPGVRLGADIPAETQNKLTKLFEQVANLFFQSAQTKPFGIEIRFSGNVPIARGLGYSATLRVGLLAALNELSGRAFDRNQLLDLAFQLEGHPDNASRSIFGGFTVSSVVDGHVRCLHFAVPKELKLVTLIPEFAISTEAARKLMPASYSKADAVHGLNRAALITAALASGDLRALRGVFDDRIHQPYREPLIPPLNEVIRASEKAGAIGGFLSGSGSAIMCLALENSEQIGAAMQQVLPQSDVLILAPDNNGFLVERSRAPA
jgi:homoserine kinase